MNARLVAGSTITDTTAWTTARPKNTDAVAAWVSSNTKADTARAPTNEVVATSHGRATFRSPGQRSGAVARDEPQVKADADPGGDREQEDDAQRHP